MSDASWPVMGGESPQSSLPLQTPAARVEGASEHHETQRLEHPRGVQRRLHSVGEATGLVEHAERLYRFGGGDELRLERHRRGGEI